MKRIGHELTPDLKRVHRRDLEQVGGLIERGNGVMRWRGL